jgi:hypothetical protein
MSDNIYSKIDVSACLSLTGRKYLFSTRLFMICFNLFSDVVRCIVILFAVLCCVVMLVWCGVVWCGVVWCGVLLCCKVMH